DSRKGVGETKRVGRILRHEMFVSHAIEVPAEGDPILRSVEVETVVIAVWISKGVSRENVGLVAIGTERETARCTRVEVSLGENVVTAGGNDAGWWNAIFLRRIEIVADKPVAHVHVIRCGVIQF